jgi:uroporphyrinogen-III synthase
MMTLEGLRVLVTRPAHQAENLCRLISTQGGVAVRFPTLAIVEPDNLAAVQSTLQHLNDFTWMIFTSSNAVNFALKANSGKIAEFKARQIAAIGKATADALKLAGLSIQALPEQNYNSEALLALPAMQNVQGQKMLIVRGEGGREELANTLRARGADVCYLNVYKRTIPNSCNNDVSLLLEQQQLDIITATSVETLQNLLIMLDTKYHSQLFALPLIVVSDRIKQVANEMGFKRIAVARSPSDEAILETINQRTGE